MLEIFFVEFGVRIFLFFVIVGFDFNEAYKLYKQKLVHYLTKWTKDLSISEDFADEAFIQSLEKIETFKIRTVKP